MPNDSSDWKSAIAQQVCTLVRDPRVLDLFREQCTEFCDEQKQDKERLAAWKSRRREHCQAGLHTLEDIKARSEETKRLGDDREAIERTRPAEDSDKSLVFDYYHQEEFESDELARLGSRSIRPMFVWVPHDLSLAYSPTLAVPDLFGRFTCSLHSSQFGRSIHLGPASLAEKYASLSAIHDSLFPEREPIDSLFPELEPIEDLRHINRGTLTDELRRRSRATLRKVVCELPDTARANLVEWLGDVEADVAQHQSPLSAAAPDPTQSPLHAAARHSEDFRSVHWFGVDYAFTANQAAVAKELWKAWENGTPELSDAYLLAKAEIDCKRLPDVFRDSKTRVSHAAWDTMIIAGTTKGTRRLSPAPESKIDTNPT